MHKLIFYPVGNGDTSQIILENGTRMLFDFRHRECGEFDLEARLRKELQNADRNYFDVVAFSHADNDHIAGSTEFFELEHASKYQGGGRIKIKELWVPAAMLLESGSNDQMSSEFIILRQEARHRLREGKGIKVFSRPDMLKDWFIKEKISFEERKHLIIDAGKTVPGYDLNEEGVELFCHSPFVEHVADGDILRNEAALIFQIRFNVAGLITNYLAIGDSVSHVLEKIVQISYFHKRQDKLNWDILKAPHHCSYLALNDLDKGIKKTEPPEDIKTLLLHGQENAYIISSSRSIEECEESYEQFQPPHIQAKNCYEHYLQMIKGRKLLVTMDTPRESLEFEITNLGCVKCNPKNHRSSTTDSIVSTPVRRAG